MLEPSLSEVHADLVGRFELDKRTRDLEKGYAAQGATVTAMSAEIHAMRDEARADKAELLVAIKDSKPNLWPAVAAITGIVVVVLALAAAIYGTPT